MINYIVQVLFCQVLFLAVYDLFLKKETFFKWNRLYLLGTPVLSFIIPLIKFDSFKETVPQEYIVMLPEVVLNPQVIVEQSVNSVETINYSLIVFYSGLLLFLGLFVFKIFKLVGTILSNEIRIKEGYKLVLLKEKQSAFSFFKYIFIHQNLKEKRELQIIQHEMIHCKQYHTVDLLFFELLKIAMWFNPLVYLYQKRITLLHEYISDAEVVKETDKKSYFEKLLSETFNVESISFVNQFYKHSLIKKRIAMITKNKSKKFKQLKYLMLIPLLGGMLLYSSCETNDSVVETSKILEANIAPRTIYADRRGEVLKTTGEKETYLDFYMGAKGSPILLEGKKIAYGDLLSEEKLEYDQFFEKYAEIMNKYKTDISLFQISGGRRVIVNQHISPENKKLDRDQFKDKEDVPFVVVDESPIFYGCTGNETELKSCLNKRILLRVNENFNRDLANNLGLKPGEKKIYIKFKILKDGGIEIVGARAPHPDLEKEAKRVVNLLPKMKPGKMFGQPVNVTYMLPISFNVEASDSNIIGYGQEKETPSIVVEEKIL